MLIVLSCTITIAISVWDVLLSLVHSAIDSVFDLQG